MTARFLSRPRRDTVEILAYLDSLRSLAVSKPDRVEPIQGLQTSDVIIDDAAHMPLSPCPGTPQKIRKLPLSGAVNLITSVASCGSSITAALSLRFNCQ